MELAFIDVYAQCWAAGMVPVGLVESVVWSKCLYLCSSVSYCRFACLGQNGACVYRCLLPFFVIFMLGQEGSQAGNKWHRLVCVCASDQPATLPTWTVCIA